MLILDCEPTVQTSLGRIDAVLELEDKVYIFEFKYSDCSPDTPDTEKRKLFDKTLEEGVKQIEERGYHRKFERSGKEIIKAAFSFLGRDEVEMRVF